MSRDVRKAQKDALKRRKREKEIREAKARERARRAEEGGQRVPDAVGELPVAECVVSKGWKERGLAHILVARTLPSSRLIAAGFYVDTWCVGLKNTAVLPNLDPAEYERSVKPNLFNDPVEFEPCDPGLARAIVEGAIEFAGRFGFRPNKRWEETRKLLEGFEPAASSEVSFGKEGKPHLVVRAGEAAAGAVARLERTAGAGNYTVERPPEG